MGQLPLLEQVSGQGPTKCPAGLHWEENIRNPLRNSGDTACKQGDPSWPWRIAKSSKQGYQWPHKRKDKSIKKKEIFNCQDLQSGFASTSWTEIQIKNKCCIAFNVEKKTSWGNSGPSSQEARAPQSTGTTVPPVGDNWRWMAVVKYSSSWWRPCLKNPCLRRDKWHNYYVIWGKLHLKRFYLCNPCKKKLQWALCNLVDVYQVEEN